MTPQPSDRKERHQNAPWALFQAVFLKLPEQSSNYFFAKSRKSWQNRLPGKTGLILQQSRSEMSQVHEDYNWKGAIEDSYFTNEETNLERWCISPDHSESEADMN